MLDTLIFAVICVPILWGRVHLLLLMFSVGFIVNLLYFLHPIVYEWRYIWVPFIEEAAKAFAIVKSEEKKRIEWVRTSVILGIVDGYSQMSMAALDSAKMLEETGLSQTKLSFYSLFYGVVILVLHAGFALFYQRRLYARWYLFMIPPLAVHLIWNISRQVV